MDGSFSWHAYRAAHGSIVVPRHIFAHATACSDAGMPMSEQECYENALGALRGVKMVAVREATEMITTVTENASHLQPEHRRSLVANINQLIGKAPASSTEPGRSWKRASTTDVRGPTTTKVPQQNCICFPWFLTLREWKILMQEDLNWDAARVALLDRCSELGLINADEATEMCIYATALLAAAPEGRISAGQRIQSLFGRNEKPSARHRALSLRSRYHAQQDVCRRRFFVDVF